MGYSHGWEWKDQWINEHIFEFFDTLEVICVSSFGIVLEENLLGIHDENLKKSYIV